MFNTPGQTHSKSSSVLWIVTILFMLINFHNEIISSFSTLTYIFCGGTLIVFATLNSLQIRIKKERDSYLGELLLIVVLSILFTLTLSQHKKYLWILPFALNKLAYEVACAFAFEHGESISKKIDAVKKSM